MNEINIKYVMYVLILMTIQDKTSSKSYPSLNDNLDHSSHPGKKGYPKRESLV